MIVDEELGGEDVSYEGDVVVQKVFDIFFLEDERVETIIHYTRWKI